MNTYNVRSLAAAMKKVDEAIQVLTNKEGQLEYGSVEAKENFARRIDLLASRKTLRSALTAEGVHSMLFGITLSHYGEEYYN